LNDNNFNNFGNSVYIIKNEKNETSEKVNEEKKGSNENNNLASVLFDINNENSEDLKFDYKEFEQDMLNLEKVRRDLTQLHKKAKDLGDRLYSMVKIKKNEKNENKMEKKEETSIDMANYFVVSDECRDKLNEVLKEHEGLNKEYEEKKLKLKSLGNEIEKRQNEINDNKNKLDEAVKENKKENKKKRELQVKKDIIAEAIIKMESDKEFLSDINKEVKDEIKNAAVDILNLTSKRYRECVLLKDSGKDILENVLIKELNKAQEINNKKNGDLSELFLESLKSKMKKEGEIEKKDDVIEEKEMEEVRKQIEQLQENGIKFLRQSEKEYVKQEEEKKKNKIKAIEIRSKINERSLLTEKK